MGKLVRDRIPEIIRADGREPDVRTLDDAEYLHELHVKLHEEADELAAASGDQVAEELADVLEVVQAIARANGVDMGQVGRVADRKRSDRGGFNDRAYLNSW